MYLQPSRCIDFNICLYSDARHMRTRFIWKRSKNLCSAFIPPPSLVVCANRTLLPRIPCTFQLRIPISTPRTNFMCSNCHLTFGSTVSRQISTSIFSRSVMTRVNIIYFLKYLEHIGRHALRTRH